ncbi:hypothetical protein EDB80DRAFT_900410 [Ilyonectria destructans]|nr:hypothetical protein EDB80DRAFT_900410 [Ilyonectria destructans]
MEDVPRSDRNRYASRSTRQADRVVEHRPSRREKNHQEASPLIEVPLVLHRVGTRSANRADLDNQIATYLNINSDSGFVPPTWQSHVGTIVVARKDRKPLRCTISRACAGLDILRTGTESIDSFDAKSYECRVEFLGIRFASNQMGALHSTSNRTCHISFDIESNGAKHSIDFRSIRSNRTPDCRNTLEGLNFSIIDRRVKKLLARSYVTTPELQ